MSCQGEGTREEDREDGRERRGEKGSKERSDSGQKSLQERRLDGRHHRPNQYILCPRKIQQPFRKERGEMGLTSITLPGTLHACFHMAVRESTAITWTLPCKLLSAYPCNCFASDEMSANVLGSARGPPIGSDERDAMIGKSESTKSVTSNNNGVYRSARSVELRGEFSVGAGRRTGSGGGVMKRDVNGDAGVRGRWCCCWGALRGIRRASGFIVVFPNSSAGADALESDEARIRSVEGGEREEEKLHIAGSMVRT